MKWKSAPNGRRQLLNGRDAFDVDEEVAGGPDVGDVAAAATDDDDDVDQRSISSESSGDGGGIAADLPNVELPLPPPPPAAVDGQCGTCVGTNDWQANDEIEQIVRELPDSAHVLDALTAGDFSRESVRHTHKHSNVSMVNDSIPTTQSFSTTNPT